MRREALRELQLIHRERSRYGFIPGALATLVSLNFHFEKLSQGHLWIFTVLLMVWGGVARFLITEFFFDEWFKKKTWAQLLSLSGFFALGLSLGTHFFDIYTKIGPDSNSTYLILLMASSFVTAASTSLVADPTSYHTYVSTIYLTCLFPYFYFADFHRYYIILFMVFYYVFGLVHYRMGRRQLMEFLNIRLKASEEQDRLKNIINMVPGHVVIFDKQLRVLVASRETLKPYPDIVGKVIGEVDSNSGWEKYVKRFMSEDKDHSVSEVLTSIKGEKTWALVNMQKTDNGGGIVVSIKIDELIEARQSLREHEAKAQYAAKLSSLGEMAAGIAHEINNPLTIIQGSASIIQKIVSKEPIDRTNLDYLCSRMVDTTDRISKTVRSLKALSRNGERDPFVDVSLLKLIDQALDICGQRFRRHEIELTLPDFQDAVKVKGREVELGQVLLNLLSNAVDATKSQDIKWVKISYEIKESWFDLYIEDSGAGVPPEIRHRIMEPFFTTKDVNSGTGLGLSISKGIMHNHGGELSLLSDRKHTTFRMRLPYGV